MVLISVYIAMLLTNWGERCTEMHRDAPNDAPRCTDAPPRAAAVPATTAHARPAPAAAAGTEHYEEAGTNGTATNSTAAEDAEAPRPPV